MENSITQQIVELFNKEEAFSGKLGGTEVLRWTAYWSREDLGANSSQFADAMETLGVKRGTALNRWSDMKRNMEGLD